MCAGADLTAHGADFVNHIYSAEYVSIVAGIAKDRVTFVRDYWDAVPYLFIAPQDFGEFGVEAGPVKATQAKPDPRVKPEDNSATAPFVAKDVKKYWKGEVAAMLHELQDWLRGYDGEFTVEAFGPALEEDIKGKEWPMGQVMNCLRLSLAGAASGLGIAEIVTTIGVGEAVRRIDFAISRLSA